MSAKPRNSPKPSERAKVLTHARNLKMARSAHAYVRGSTVKFYEWLEQSSGKLPAGPSVWICGDCHIGNLGPLADAKGGVDIQIRDLDQTVIGNPAHDLVRLGLSLASAARGSDLPGVTTARMLEAIVEGYEAALAEDLDVEAEPAPIIGAALKLATQRKWKHLAGERLDDLGAAIPQGKRFWPLRRAERQEIEALVETAELRDLVTVLKGRGDNDVIRLIDAAYWMKGCSSLGRLRYAVLLAVERSKDGKRDLCLLDVKEAVRAAAPRDPSAAMPRGNAERVVQGACALSPNLGRRMAASRLLDKSVVVRELMPQDMKIELESLTQDEAIGVARSLSRVVGEAHGRQMDDDTRRAWLADLSRDRSGGLEAPSWLWSSVVELTGVHEIAYLEHCRRYALGLED